MPTPPFVFPVLSALGALGLARSAMPQDHASELTWHDAAKLTIEGRGWADTDGPFTRLPARAKEMVRDVVWQLSRDSAGLVVRFSTDATALHARWVLTSERLAMPHMTATGVSGLDLYTRDESGRWRWLASGRPRLDFEAPSLHHRARLVTGLEPGRRDYMLYLPLYNGVESLEIGVPDGRTVEALPPRTAKPIVFYGTSITQGGCASRPGMTHTAILGRRLRRPVINLGFSGNGEMELAVAQLLAELDPAVYVIDCLPNMSAKQVSERTEPLVRVLRTARPTTPILLVEDRSYQDGWLVAARRDHNAANRRALRRELERLQAAGVEQLHYLEGAALLGDDGEATVDGSHPTDLGFVRQADAFERALRPLLGGGGQPR